MYEKRTPFNLMPLRNLRCRPADVSSAWRRAPQHGRGDLNIDFATVPGTIEDLLRESDLVVDGRVISVLPSVRLNAASWIQTDSLVAVMEVLSGATTGDTIAVSQPGGKMGELEQVFSMDRMMAVGERYIFFLRRDRGASPNVINYVRYYPPAAGSGRPKWTAREFRFQKRRTGLASPA